MESTKLEFWFQLKPGANCSSSLWRKKWSRQFLWRSLEVGELQQLFKRRTFPQRCRKQRYWKKTHRKCPFFDVFCPFFDVFWGLQTIGDPIVLCKWMGTFVPLILKTMHSTFIHPWGILPIVFSVIISKANSLSLTWVTDARQCLHPMLNNGMGLVCPHHFNVYPSTCWLYPRFK